MADKQINIKLNVDTSQADTNVENLKKDIQSVGDETVTVSVKTDGAQTIGELKQQFKDLKKDIDGLAEGTDAYNKKLAEINKVNFQLKEFKKDLKDASASARQLGDIGDGFGAIAKGASGAVGAIALVGGITEENAQKVTAMITAFDGVGTALSSLPQILLSCQKGFAALNAVILANPYVAIAAAVIALAGAIYLLSQNSKQAAEDQAKLINELNKTIVSQKIISEQNQLNALQNDIRRDKIEGVNQSISDQVNSLNKLRDANNALFEAKKDEAKLDLATINNYDKLVDGITKINNLRDDEKLNLENLYGKDFYKAIENADEQDKSLLRLRVERQKEAILLTINSLNNQQDSFNLTQRESIQKLYADEAETAKQKQKEINDNKLKSDNELYGNINTMNQAITDQQVKDSKEGINEIVKYTKDSQANMLPTIGLSRNLPEEKMYQSLIDLNNKYSGNIIGNESNMATERLKIQEQYFKDLLAQTNLSVRDRLQLEEQLGDTQIAIQQKTYSDNLNIAGNTLQGTEQLVGSISQLFQTASDNRINEAQNEQTEAQDALQKRYDSGVISTQQYNDQLAAINDNANAKLDKEKRKAFEQQKALNIVQAIIAGALGIVQIIATTPKVDFGASTIAWLAISAAATVANIAVIAAQKYPESGSSGGSGAGSSGISAPDISASASLNTANVYGNNQGSIATATRVANSGNENTTAGLVGPPVVIQQSRVRDGVMTANMQQSRTRFN